MPTRHPALYAGYQDPHAFSDTTPDGPAHFVPEGWEEANVGACPCGELVRWDDQRERWTPDRSLVALILPADVADVVRSSLDDLRAPYSRAEKAPAVDLIGLQLALNRSTLTD